MKKKSLLAICLVTVLVLSLVGACAAPAPAPTPAPAPAPAPAPTPAPEKVFEISYACSLSPMEYPTELTFADMVEEQSGGRLKLKVLWPGEHPFKDADMLEAAATKSVDMAWVATSYIDGIEPILCLADQFFLAENIAAFTYLFENVRSLYFDPTLANKYNQKHLLNWSTVGYSIFTIDTPFDSLEALKGKKIRIYNEETSRICATWGATPVSIAYAEIYPSLQKGVIDGMTASVSSALQSKYYEVVKHVTLFEMTYAAHGPSINLDVFNNLTPELQGVLLYVSEKMQPLFRKYKSDMAWEAYNALKEMPDFHFHQISPEFRKKLEEMARPIVREDRIKRIGPRAKLIYDVMDAVRADWLAMSDEEQHQWCIDAGQYDWVNGWGPDLPK